MCKLGLSYPSQVPEHCISVPSPAVCLSLAFLSAPGFCLQAVSLLFCLSVFHVSFKILKFPILLLSWMLTPTLCFPATVGWDSCPAHGCSPPSPTVRETHSFSCNGLCPPHGSCPLAIVPAAPSPCSRQWGPNQVRAALMPETPFILKISFLL